jgi:serine/threonine protein kinase
MLVTVSVCCTALIFLLVCAVFSGNGYKGSVYLIFEYLEHDLCGLHERIQKATSTRAAMDHSMVKSFTWQMLQGLAHCHEHNVLHRDLKASNLLISRDGVLKLADFGLARPYVSSSGRIGELTYRVCTLWYRCAVRTVFIPAILKTRAIALFVLRHILS